MELSTIIVLAIAVFIIVYRIKTWNEVNVLAKDEIVEEVVEYKIDEPTVSTVETKTKKEPAKKTTAKKTTAAKSSEKKPAAKPYKKSLKADLAKNQALSDALKNSLGEQLVFELKSKPKAGMTTLITLIPSLTQGDRAVGLVYEKSKTQMTIIKSFDVKMQTNDQFKVATTFAKSLTVKKADMSSKVVEATQLFVSEDKSVNVSDVVLTLK